MYVLITLGLLVLATVILAALRLSRSSASYSWLVATLAGLLVWVSVLLWQFNLPQRFFPTLWRPEGLFSASPEFLADPLAWLYALSLAALAAAVVLTSPAQEANVLNPTAWAATFILTALGFMAVLADNPLTLVLCWSMLDLVEFFNTLRTSDSPSLSERAVVSFSVRAAGTGIALWASVISSSKGQALLFESASPDTGIFLLFAAGLRLGILPLHLTYRNEPILRRGFGTMLRLITASTSLILLARLPISAIPAGYIPYLLIFVALAALYGGWGWLFSRDEITGRPFWIIGMSALSLAAALRGSPQGSAGWGAAMIIFGGISFLYSARNVWITRALAVLGLFSMALPFTLTATSWNGAFPWPFLFWPLFLLAHLMLMAGYSRHLFDTSEATFTELPTWAQASYPMGLALLGLTAVLAGLWGWQGALQIGNWVAGVILVVTGALIVTGIWQFRRFSPTGLSLPSGPRISRLADLLDLLAKGFWAIYRLTTRIFDAGTYLLEGDGGLLWTLLLLALFITIFRSR